LKEAEKRYTELFGDEITSYERKGLIRLIESYDGSIVTFALWEAKPGGIVDSPLAYIEQVCRRISV